LAVYLAGLALAIIVPSLGLGVTTALHIAQNYRGAFENRLIDTARALASALDAQLGAAITAVETLAASPLLDDEETHPQFYVQAKRVGDAFGTYVVVSSPQPPRQVLNTRFPVGAGLPPMVAPDVVADILRSGRTALTDLRVPPALAQHVVGAVTPVRRDGAEPTLAVVLPFRPARLAGVLQAQELFGGALAMLVDGNAAIVARSAEQERFVGQPIPEEFRAQMRGRDGGLVEGASIDGEQMVLGFQRLRKAPEWTVVVAEPAANHREAWRVPLIRLISGGALALALGVVLSAVVAQRILRPVATLTKRAEATALSGLSVPLAPLPYAQVAEFQLLQTAVNRAEASLRGASARLEAALRAAQLGTYEHDLATNTANWDARATEILGGLSPQHCATGVDAWRERVHPDDRAALAAAFGAAFSPSGRDTYKVAFRFRGVDGGWVWVAAYGAVTERQPETGRAIRMAGVLRDVTEVKAAEERQQLLLRELDHRAKNALAVVQAALRLTPRNDAASYARDVERRVNALARAHSLLAESRWFSAEFRAVARGELDAFLPAGSGVQPGGGPSAVEYAGPNLLLRPEAVQPIAMVLHELAANAMKHGALSVPDGRIRLSWQADMTARALRVSWAERGGPPVLAPLRRRGFGTRVIETTVQHQLRGRVACHWNRDGLVCELDLPIDLVLNAAASV